MADDTTNRELNRLYWESDASISEIANQLDISRRALYDGIESRPAGRDCPECGAPLGYRNRTALENGEAECPECGLTVQLDAGEPGRQDRTEPAGDPSRSTDTDEVEERARRAPSLPELEDAPMLSTVFLAGLAMGALAAHLIRRH